MYSNSHSMSASNGHGTGQGLGPGAPVACNQRISPRMDAWFCRAVVFNA
jgi:hypothetical protein